MSTKPQTDAILEHWDFDADNCHEPLVELCESLELRNAELTARIAELEKKHEVKEKISDQTIENLRAALAEARKDGQRYQFLRANRCISDDGDGWLSLSFNCQGQYDSMTKEMQGEALDAEIDRATPLPTKEAR